MSLDDARPVLTDARGMGGIIAQDGFDYQLWDGLTRLPAWLANPAFEQMIFEGLEDLEARFFAPHADRGRVVERYQAKGGALTPAGVRGVLETFKQFEDAYPKTARLHALVTPKLPPTVAWLAKDPERVRRARPFYAPFADILAASDGEVRRSLDKEYGEALGTFIARTVEVQERNLTDRDTALAQFSIAMDRAFPHLDASARDLGQAFDALEGLARRLVGAPIGRAALIAEIETAVRRGLFPDPLLRLHVRSDRNGVEERRLEIDASGFSGGADGFPEANQWAQALTLPLDRTSGWLREHGVNRVGVGGSYRLTTAVLLGAALRSAIGFDLEIETRDGAWATDDRPSGDEGLVWAVSEATQLVDDQLIVSIGVLRDPMTELAVAGLAAPSVLSMHLAAPIPSAQAAQASVSLIKRTVDAAVATLRPAGLRLYFAGPAALAVALGHRWNAMPTTQLYEFVSPARVYVPTARL